MDEEGFSGEEVLVLPNLAASTTYYVRVHNFYSSTPTPINYLYGEEFEIAIIGNIVIPVELVTFTGQTKGTQNVLNWQTASERNAQSFIVERSADGKNDFVAIGTNKAAGTTSTPQYYTFIDENPLPLSYYRLRQVDFDGKEDLSKVVTVQRKDKKLALEKAFPSPVMNELTVQYSVERNGDVSLQVLDVFGRLLIRQNIAATEGANLSKINLDKLAVRTYILLLSDGQKSAQMRVVKQ